MSGRITDSPCLVDGCGTEARSRGLCVSHYNQFAHQGKHADVILPPRNRKRKSVCAIFGCSAAVHSLDLCNSHYWEWRDDLVKRGGKPRVRPIGDRQIASDGYATLKLESGVVAEHRYVMNQMIGRPLVKGESVHHKNGNRSDNRPENLELWFSQPAGQRVEDLISYVVTHQRKLLDDALVRQ